MYIEAPDFLLFQQKIIPTAPSVCTKSGAGLPRCGESPAKSYFIRSASALVLAVVGNFIVRQPHDVVNAGFVKLGEPFHNQKRGLKLSRFVSGVCLLGTVKIFGKLALVEMVRVPKLFKSEIHTLPPLLYFIYIMTYYLNL